MRHQLRAQELRGTKGRNDVPRQRRALAPVTASRNNVVACLGGHFAQSRIGIGKEREGNLAEENNAQYALLLPELHM